MTHAELVERAERWLRKTVGCRVVLTECRSRHEDEVPDAIGWRAEYGQLKSIVVEVKASRADFRADGKKDHRKAGGLGRWRYFLTPPGLVGVDELPPGWGLLEALAGGVRKVKPPGDRGRDDARTARETYLMYSELTLYQGICLGMEPIPSRRVDWIIGGLDANLSKVKSDNERNKRAQDYRRAAERADRKAHREWREALKRQAESEGGGRCDGTANADPSG